MKTPLSEIIKKFYRIGVGNKTEFRTVVTDHLIDITKKRLLELQQKRLNIRGGSNNGVK